MAKISVEAKQREGGWACHVEVVDDDGSSTHHVVSVKKSDYERITDGKLSVEDLLKKSFEFLLEREAKESILREFDLMTIARYFPEYEEEIMKKD